MNSIEGARGKVGRILIGIFLFAAICVTTLPILHIVSKAFSQNTAVTAGKVIFWPVGFQTGNFAFIVSKTMFGRSFANSLFVTGVGTLLSLLLTASTAYPLSKPELRGRKGFVLMFVFSMLFNGGIVPIYLMIRALGLLDRLWSLIVPFLIIPFNMLIMKTFFEGLPESIEQAALIDGASYFQIFGRIILPMSTPVLATISLFYAVGYWNSVFQAMMYITKAEMKPLQLFLYEIVREADRIREGLTPEEAMSITPGGIVAAVIVVSTVPIMAVYPFLQKYFVHGITLGSVKG